MSIQLFDIQQLTENEDIEVKKSVGRDGQGELPKNFWETYSAMANTKGGTLFLGIEQTSSEQFKVVGIVDTNKVRKSLWDGLNNREIISVNLLTNDQVEVREVEGKSILKISVPKASRRHRPVYIGSNPLKGTFRRGFEGDYRCDEETVRRMVAEQVEDSRDSRLLEGFGLNDLDLETLKSYRNKFRSTKPDHPWLNLDDLEFLRSIGAWTKDRQTGNEGLTLAGLLFFGKLPAILEGVPNYIVDYQEKPESKTETRWIDRLTTDGTWSGNLYDFYRQVIQKLYRDLKVPFRLEGSTRIDDTPVHEAVREALVNTMIHADFTGRVSILVIKQTDLFSFRNPGTMRLTLEDALRGGNSDCRNRNLQKMFQLVGEGEQAGSGIPKIYTNWKKQHWRDPELNEQTEPDQTTLILRMVSLLPEETLRRLDERFGAKFRKLTETHRLALATVEIEGHINHSRLRDITKEHPHDLTKVLTSLVKEGYLKSDGNTRGTFYFFPDQPPKWVSTFLTSQKRGTNPLIAGQNPLITDQNPPLATENPLVIDPSPELLAIARPARDKKRIDPKTMERLILELCTNTWLTPKELSSLLSRNPRNLPLWKLKQAGVLEAHFPNQQAHPGQAYKTTEKGKQRIENLKRR